MFEIDCSGCSVDNRRPVKCLLLMTQIMLTWAWEETKEIEGSGKIPNVLEEESTELTDEGSEEKRGIKSDS